MRLNHYISKSGYTSRRKADTLIKEGRVKVNGRVVREPFLNIEDNGHVEVNGKIISLKKDVYIIFHKPRGVTTTLEDKFASKKVIDFFPKDIVGGVYPVGRLDRDSSGLIILTNDGDFCYRLTHPKFGVEKEYLMKVEGRLKITDCKTAQKGVNDMGDLLKVKEVRILRSGTDNTLCKVIICEGKKRHLRRLFEKLGFRVKELKRMRIGGVVLGGLKEGEYEMMPRDKIYQLAALQKTRRIISSA